jgi:hypothetical protein
MREICRASSKVQKILREKSLHFSLLVLSEQEDLAYFSPLELLPAIKPKHYRQTPLM